MVVGTFNYDTLVERALSTVQYDAQSGRTYRLDMMNVYPETLNSATNRTHHGAHLAERTPTFSYSKLHGSVNYNRGTRSEGQIYYIGSSYWDPIEAAELDAIGPVADKTPLIIPPVLDKTKLFEHPTIRSIWKGFGKELRRADRVFSLGYSLPETDLSVRFFLQGCQPLHPVKWYLIDVDSKHRQRFTQLLPACYEIDDTYSGEECVPRFVAALTGDLV